MFQTRHQYAGRKPASSKTMFAPARTSGTTVLPTDGITIPISLEVIDAKVPAMRLGT